MNKLTFFIASSSPIKKFSLEVTILAPRNLKIAFVSGDGFVFGYCIEPAVSVTMINYSLNSIKAENNLKYINLTNREFDHYKFL